MAARKKPAKPAKMVRETLRAVRPLRVKRDARPINAGPVPSDDAMVAAAFRAFVTLAERWELSSTEQNTLLGVSDSTRLRWIARAPVYDPTIADRLRLILLSYQRLHELTGGPDAELARFVRRTGSADNPALPKQTLLEALSSPSVLDMYAAYRRLEAELYAS
jgi:hypothetical protein